MIQHQSEETYNVTGNAFANGNETIQNENGNACGTEQNAFRQAFSVGFLLTGTV